MKKYKYNKPCTQCDGDVPLVEATNQKNETVLEPLYWHRDHSDIANFIYNGEPPPYVFCGAECSNQWFWHRPPVKNFTGRGY